MKEEKKFIAVVKHKGKWIAGILEEEDAKKFHKMHEGIKD